MILLTRCFEHSRPEGHTGRGCELACSCETEDQESNKNPYFNSVLSLHFQRSNAWGNVRSGQRGVLAQSRLRAKQYAFFSRWRSEVGTIFLLDEAAAMTRSRVSFTVRFPLVGLLGWLVASGAIFKLQAQESSPAQPAVDRTILPHQRANAPSLHHAGCATPKRLHDSRCKLLLRFNVLIVLIDDMGFGQSSAFGGPIPMPTLDKVARGGIKYNQFHTTALCSPTRAALLSGRNHHVCNMGSITETATSFPGQTGQRPNAVAPLAEMLRLNGYSTAAFGKSHETATGNQILRPHRSLADALGLRQVLWLHRRQGESMVTGAL